MPHISAFISYIFLTAYTPGPNNIMAMSNAGKYGFWKGLRFCAGALLGFVIVMSASAAFGSMLFYYIPAIEPVMKYIGPVYILYLAYMIYKDKPHSEKKQYLETNCILTGMLLQLVNVKVILYGITAFTTFILPYYQSIPVLILFVFLLSAVGSTGNLLWALFGSLFQKLFTKHQKIFNTAMALLLAYCAVSAII